MIEDFPKNEMAFDHRFRHERNCLDYLFELRWPNRFVCPTCGHAVYWRTARGLLVCRQCQTGV